MTAPGFNNSMQCVSFKLSDSLIGINILDIREIVPCRRITRISNAADFVLGLMNLRGQILTILDIGVLLGFEKRQIRGTSHVIVFKHRDIGFIVDRIGDVVGIRNEDINQIPANIDTAVQEFMEYVVNMPDDILMLLNANKVLSKSRAKISQAKES